MSSYASCVGFIRPRAPAQPFDSLLLLPQASALIGSGEGCQLRLSGPGVEPRHAEVYEQGGRVFCRPLVGDSDDPRAETKAWIMPDAQLRPGVKYLLSPGAELSFGELGQNTVVVEFEESGGSDGGTAQMLMGAMAQGASDHCCNLISCKSKGTML
jgi:hypothetical protein